MGSKIQQFFIRPQRQTYYNYDLGPPVFFIDTRKVIRTDFVLNNQKGHKIMVSFYQFQYEMQDTSVVYLHTHHGSRLEGTPLVESILKQSMNLCLFDFGGYGNSDGDTVTLGIQQIWDIEVVINHLQSSFKQNKFILWGRSMGAVCALLFLHQKKNIPHKIIGGIYDSPFYSLEKLTLQLGSKNSGIPQLILKPLVYILKNSLHNKIDFSKLQLQQKIQQIKIPGLFITSKQDKFINYQHSQILYKNYQGYKQLHYIQKDHNQTRKQNDLKSVLKFIQNNFIQDSNKKWKVILNNNLQYMFKNRKLYQENFSK